MGKWQSLWMQHSSWSVKLQQSEHQHLYTQIEKSWVQSTLSHKLLLLRQYLLTYRLQQYLSLSLCCVTLQTGPSPLWRASGSRPPWVTQISAVHTGAVGINVNEPPQGENTHMKLMFGRFFSLELLYLYYICMPVYFNVWDVQQTVTRGQGNKQYYDCTVLLCYDYYCFY